VELLGENVVGPQVAEFVFGDGGQRQFISIAARDVAALVTILESAGAGAASAAAKIARATRLHEGESVALKIGEDESVLAALEELCEQRGRLGGALKRLESGCGRRSTPDARAEPLGDAGRTRLARR